MLTDLEKGILEEYDNSQEISVRVNLLPKYHNTISEYEKIIDEKGERETLVNEQNEELKKTLVSIHEATPGKTDGTMPTKPERNKVDILHYEKLVRYGAKNRAYGIERLCGEEQNYHLAIANQAMLSAFVLRELGYDKESAMRHIFPHNFYSKIDKECSVRMLYASKLLKFIMDMDDYDAYTKDPTSYNYAERKKNKLKVNNIDSIELTGPRELRESISRLYLKKMKKILIDK